MYLTTFLIPSERSNNEESQSLQHIDPKMIELIRSEIMVGSTGVGKLNDFF